MASADRLLEKVEKVDECFRRLSEEERGRMAATQDQTLRDLYLGLVHLYAYIATERDLKRNPLGMRGRK